MTTPQTALAVIEEALREARFGPLPLDAPAVLARVLAALSHYECVPDDPRKTPVCPNCFNPNTKRNPNEFVMCHCPSCSCSWNENRRRAIPLTALGVEKYLKEDETVAECLERNQKDVAFMLGALAKERKRVEELTALGGEPVARMELRAMGRPRVEVLDVDWTRFGFGVEIPLYAHPAPPIDLAAVRAVAEEMRELNKLGYVKELPIRYAADWTDRLLRAIGGAAECGPANKP